MSKPVPFFHVLDVPLADRPDLFTYPFSYAPHSWAIAAADQVKQYLQTQQEFDHPFWLADEHAVAAIGKMFGVMVVEASDGSIGFLASVSGKLANTNSHRFFVPPVYDLLAEDGFFLREEQHINQINADIQALTDSPEWERVQQHVATVRTENEAQLQSVRNLHKQNKRERKAIRANLQGGLNQSSEVQEILEDLIKQSYRDQHEYDVLKQQCRDTLALAEQELAKLTDQLTQLREERKRRSSTLQQQIFDQYQFLNAKGEVRPVLQIFHEALNIVPPAGAGECAAPKLFQYAYQHGLTPICMAEFWWGASPSSEVRIHEHYYPSCRGKCEPILNFMMQGLSVAPNPLSQTPATPAGLDIIYEDQDLIVVNKPAELLSVPGIHIKDSVYSRILSMRPEISGPVIIHRLDMSTSGILVLARHKEAHRLVQDQFIKHQVQKRYTALLTGEILNPTGLIDLPLRVDLDDRPRQMVCDIYGKPAQTRYEVQEVAHHRTRIHFYPLTGRTHQLRVHAAHSLGLHTPIVGDDLYGVKADRLHLHAGFIAFAHPSSGEVISFEVPDPF